jgi:hypothetical protein
MHVCLTRYRDATGIVTLDADGQHDPEDARRVGDRLDEKPGTLILGVRRFLGTVPLRSRIGNTLRSANNGRTRELPPPSSRIRLFSTSFKRQSIPSTG